MMSTTAFVSLDSHIGREHIKLFFPVGFFTTCNGCLLLVDRYDNACVVLLLVFVLHV